MRVKLLLILFFLNIFKAKGRGEIEGKISGGEKTNIQKYPHSVFMFIAVNGGAFVCGSSIINQKILLTAAHCVSVCLYNKCKIRVFAGNTNKRKGSKYEVAGFKVHENYKDKAVANDIGLVMMKKAFTLGKSMKRVALMKRKSNPKVALVAGWGIINEINNEHTEWLHHTPQKVWSLQHCRQILRNVPDGCICGGTRKSSSYVSKGDSGSALIVKNYIQIGIVSFKRPDITKSLVVYTDISYFYDWILRNVKRLMCSKTI